MSIDGAKPLAMVTGASSGIGRQLAQQFAEHGFDLLICLEDGRLRAAATELAATGPLVTPVKADLADYDGAQQLIAPVPSADRPVDARALNAGFGNGGKFEDIELSDELQLVVQHRLRGPAGEGHTARHARAGQRADAVHAAGRQHHPHPYCATWGHRMPSNCARPKRCVTT